MFSFNKKKDNINIGKYKINNKYKNIYLNYSDPTKKNNVEKDDFDSIQLKNGVCELEPFKTSKRKVIYISAPSDAGKSTLAGDFMEKYKKNNPKNKIILITPEDQKKNADPCFKKVKFSQLIINEDYCDNPLKLEELKNCLVVFDDIEGLPTKEISNEIYNLLHNILFLGRKRNISCILCNHVIKNYSKTKGILIESDYIIIFPKMANAFIYNNLLENDLKFPKKVIKEIYSIPSRYIIIHSKCPSFIFHQKGLFKI